MAGGSGNGGEANTVSQSPNTLSSVTDARDFTDETLGSGSVIVVGAVSAQAVTVTAIRAAARTARFAVSWNWLLPVIPRSDSDEGSRLRCS
jgi:hypothetical protein